MQLNRMVTACLLINIVFLTNRKCLCDLTSEDVRVQRCKRDCDRKLHDANSPKENMNSNEKQAQCIGKCLRQGFGGPAKSRERRTPTKDLDPPVLTVKECVQAMQGKNSTKLKEARNVSVQYSNDSAFVRWAPPDIPVNEIWTGYIIFWYTFRRGKNVFCKVYPKNQTSGVIRNGFGWNSSYDLNLVVLPVPTSRTPSFTSFGRPKARSKGKTTKHKPKSLTLYAVIGGSIGGAVFVTIFGVLLCYFKSRDTTQDPDVDVFITYSRKNENFVLDKLIPLLSSHSINFTIDFIDFEPGVPWMENLMDCICRSSKILIVMSSHYLASMNCKKELQQALYSKGMSSIILLRIDSVSVNDFPKAIRHRTFIDYADSVLERHTWKSRVIKALERSNGSYSRSVSQESKTVFV